MEMETSEKDMHVFLAQSIIVFRILWVLNWLPKDWLNYQNLELPT
jgi:hypothetical protein